MSIKLFLIFTLFVLGAVVPGYGQDRGQNNSVLPRPEGDEPQPKTVREMLSKLQVEQAKKEHDAMLDRGSEALKLSEEILKSYTATGTLTHEDRNKLQGIEKLAKKIRGALGGEDMDDDRADGGGVEKSAPLDVAEVIKRLPDLAGKLVNELKKTTRFSVSAAAVQSSNAVISAVRFIRGGK